MTIDRMTLLVNGKNSNGERIGTISINGERYPDCNLNWLPNYDCDLTGVSTTVHAVQWYGNHGQIELTTNGSNIMITELGALGIATSYHEQRKLELELIAEEERKERERYIMSLVDIEKEENKINNDPYFDDLLNQLLDDVDTSQNTDVDTSQNTDVDTSQNTI